MIWLRRAEVAAAGRTQTKVRPRGKQFQKMDCAAPASFAYGGRAATKAVISVAYEICAAREEIRTRVVHTHDMRGCTPLSAKRGNWRSAKRTGEMYR